MKFIVEDKEYVMYCKLFRVNIERHTKKKRIKKNFNTLFILKSRYI